MFTDRRLAMSYVWMLSLQALILCSFVNYAHSRQSFDLELCDKLNRTLKGDKINRTITNGICNLLALRDLAEGASDDVKECNTVELLDQNLNDACNLLSEPNFDKCKKELRDYCVNRHTERQYLFSLCEYIKQL